MNWKKHLFKPKWQNKNADIRLESVSTDHHPDLIGNLVEIAATDQDIRVRCAAIKRLHQLENILKLYRDEKSPEVRLVLEDRIRQLASATNESRPPLALRMQVAEMTGNRDLIEHLARNAPEVELRRAALSKVSRQGVLGDCCVQDEDAENRSYAATRITQLTTLKRVIDDLRKLDKTLHARLQQRLHKELLALGDPKAINTEALDICIGLEKLALDKDQDHSGQIKTLHAAWQDIGPRASVDMAQRYQRVCERLAEPQSPPAPVEVKAPVVIEPESEEIQHAAAETEPTPQANLALAHVSTAICLYQSENADQPSHASIKKMKAQFEKAWQRCKPPHPDDQVCWDTASAALAEMEETLELKQQQFEKELSKTTDLLNRMQTELENGELHKALETRAKIQQATQEHGKNRAWKQVNAKMAGMQARLRELRDWHHWSNNKVRKRLIAEMEVLPAADLHPDALLNRVKSLQTEWKSLEQSEQIPGDKKFMAAPWMWRKFSDAGHKAFDTAKPYLDKRSEIQSRLAQSLAGFCKGLVELAKAEPTDWTELGKGLSEGRKKLHDLNALPPGQRQKIARKLKSALEKGNAVVQARYEVVEREKMKLIRAASQLIHLPERSEAITQAKSLQSNWKAAGSLWRSKEQELWNQFREHLDPLFNELKEQQATIRAADDERLSAQRALCTELRDILKSEEDLSALHGKVQGLQDGWKDIQHPDRKLLQSFQTMVEEYQKKVDKAQLRQTESNRERWWLKADLLHALTVNGRTLKGTISKKAETSINQSWPEESSEDELEARLDQSRMDILAGETSVLGEDELEEMNTGARLLCIGLEFIAGLPSPDEDRDLRMKYQVDRLAESMSGDGIRQPADEEARDAEKIWLGMYPLPDADYSAFGERVKAALTAIIESV
jgi:exonuclease SbcC